MVASDFYKNIRLIDKCIVEGLLFDDSLYKLLEIINHQNYFFANVSSPSWFNVLKDKGFFNADKAPSAEEDKEQKGLFAMPTWNILPYLERVSKQVYEPGNEQYIDELLMLIRNVSDERVRQKESNKLALDNYRTWSFFTRILSNLPNDKIPIDVLESMSVWMDSTFDSTLPGVDIATKLLPKFLDSQKPDCVKANKIIEVITNVKPKRVSQEEIEAWGRENRWETVLDDYWLKETFIQKEYAKVIGEECNRGPITTIAGRLKDIFEQNERENVDCSYIWMPTLFSDPQYLHDDAKVILTIILRDILLAKSKTNLKETREILDSFLIEYDYPLFKRLILYISANEWNGYKDYFWQMIKRDDGKKIFNSAYYEPETYELLERNISKFKINEKNSLKEIIAKGPIPEIEDKKGDEYKVYWQQKWFSALRKDEYFKAEYEDLKKITKQDKKKPTYGVTVELSSESHVPTDKLLGISNQELANFFNELKANRVDERTIDTSVSLMAAAKEEPEKFINDLSPFLECDHLYVYEMLNGFTQAWENKKNFNWNNLLIFIKQYVYKPDFWADREEARANYSWVTGAIGSLIQAGTKSDDWAFDKAYIENAKHIILDLLGKQKAEKPQEMNDPVTTALNSSFGKLITALIYIALRKARLDKQKDIPPSFDSEIKEQYEKALEKNIYEAYVLVGQYMPNLFWMDEGWVNEKVSEFLSIDDAKWFAFIDGYLYGVNKFYPQFHAFMRRHYIKALSIEFKKEAERAEDKLIQHITIAYLRDIETIKDKNSLFRKVLDDWKYSQINETIGFLWDQKEYLIETETNDDLNEKKQQLVSKVISLWRWVYENKFAGTQNLDKNDKKILSSISRLAIFLPALDSENTEWLKLSAPFITENYNSPFLVQYLDELKEKGESEQTAEYIGNIFLEILKGTLPTFEEDHVSNIVEFLYKEGNKEAADIICNTYGENGQHFLRPFYDKYNPEI